MDLAALFAQRLVPFAADRVAHWKQAVTASGATKTISNQTIGVWLVNVGANTCFVSLDGTADTDGMPLIKDVPIWLDLTPGMTLAFDCASGETCDVHGTELYARTA